MSDDGEPAGTAGKPILEVIRGRKLTDVLVIVTRYFGDTTINVPTKGIYIVRVGGKTFKVSI